jgi:MerR family transcriptional regulator, redox-sensitive transcriptional activator SoxR
VSSDELLAIGRVAERTGLAVSAIRFYERQGLITAIRDHGGTRRFPRSTIRRVSFILIVQRLGYSLDDIRTHLDRLPRGRTPTERDWERLGQEFGADLDRRMQQLAQLKDRLSTCIGCGCLSLKRCALYNVEDNIGAKGPGPRFLLGDSPTDPSAEDV